MTRVAPALLLAAAMVTMGWFFVPAPSASQEQAEPPLMAEEAQEKLAEAPIWFETNQGQFDDDVAFVARAPAHRLLLGHEGARIALSTPEGPRLLEFRFSGTPVGEGLSEYVTNYFPTSDPSTWVRAVPHTEAVRYPAVADGIDLIFYANAEGLLEFDLEVAPGADPTAFRMDIVGATPEVRADGRLGFSGLDFHLGAPIAFQGDREVPVSFAATDDSLGFLLGAYDAGLPLRIDPTLQYGSYFGGASNDWVHELEVVGDYVYMLGTTESLTFPKTTGVWDESYGGARDAFLSKMNVQTGALVWSTFLGGNGDQVGDGGIKVAPNGEIVVGIRCATDDCPYDIGGGYKAPSAAGYDGMVARLEPDASDIIWSARLGGSAIDLLFGLDMDAAGNVYVVGQTQSTNYPTKNGYDGSCCNNYADAFLTRLKPDGTDIFYSTYFGANAFYNNEAFFDVEVEDNGRAHVAGAYMQVYCCQNTPNVPTPGGFIVGVGNCWCNRDLGLVGVFDTTKTGGGSLPFMAAIGAPVASIFGPVDSVMFTSVEVDSVGRTHVLGFTKASTGVIQPTAITPYDMSYNGGAGDLIHMAIDTNDAELSSTDKIVSNTYIGGIGTEAPWPLGNNVALPISTAAGNIGFGSALALDFLERIWVTGFTTSDFNFPIKPMNPAINIQTTCNNCGNNAPDAFVVGVDPGFTDGAGSLVMGTLLGGGEVTTNRPDMGHSILHDDGFIYAVGHTNARYIGVPPAGGFPVTGNAYQDQKNGILDATFDGWVVKIGGILPLPTPVASWSSSPPDTYHPGKVHPGNKISLVDTTDYTALFPGQVITKRTWIVDGIEFDIDAPVDDFETSFTSTGLHTVALKIWDNKGGVAIGDDIDIEVFLNPCPTVSAFQATPTEGIAQSTPILFTGVTDDGSTGVVAEWIWSFGDGSSDATPDATSHVYKFDALFQPELFALDDDGCLVGVPLPYKIHIAKTYGSEPPPEYIAKPPVADAGADQTVVSGQKVTLDASNVSGSVFRWCQLEGPVVTLSNVFAQTPSFTAPEVAVKTKLVFCLIVNDGRQDSQVDTVTVWVEPRNGPPIANAGPDATVREATTATLDGSKSKDPDGDVISYHWRQLRGPAVVLSSPIEAKPTFIVPPYSKDTRMVFQLQVHDGHKLGVPDQVVLDIQPSRDLEFKHEVEGRSSLGTVVAFTPQFSTLGFNLAWDFGDGETSTERAPTHIYAQPGRYTVTLDVSGEDGAVTKVVDKIDVGDGSRSSSTSGFGGSALQALGNTFYLALAAFVVLVPIVVVAVVLLAKRK